ncbi:hypothetical protein [Histidinibacterium lentulum]|nr:hypothetical protein [Histidinibacterium lentulum]
MDSLMNVIVFGGTALLFAGLIWQTRQRARARERGREALSALADRRGLRFDLVGDRRGERQQMRLSDPAGAFSLTISPAAPSKKGRGDGGGTVLHMQEPSFPGGLAIYSPDLHRDLPQALSTFSGALDSNLARRVLSRFLDADIAEGLGELQAFPPPGGITMSVLANVDPHPWFDAAAIARVVAEDPVARTGGRVQRIVILRRSGLDLRLTRAVTTPEELEAFLDAGLALRADLLQKAAG